MGSKGRIPPSHFRRPLPGPGLLHPDPFGPGIHPPVGSFPFDMLPPPEIMEQKLDAQLADMQKLSIENGRLAATHSTLRQELAASQQELQRLQSHMGALQSEQEQQMRAIFDKMGKMEADLQTSEPIKLELQQAHAEAQGLIAGRQELISKVQQLTQDLQRSHGDAHQIPSMMSELENLRQEYQHCRATYDYERKLRIDHYESLQLMEKNYVSMVKEVETLRTELTNLDRSVNTGGTYASNAGYKENDTSGHQSAGQNASYEDGYGGSQGRVPSGGATQYGGGPPGPAAPARAGYDAAPRGAVAYDAPRNPSYDPSRAASYEAPRGGSGYEAPRGAAGYDAPPRGGAGGSQAAMAAGNNPAAPYGSAQVNQSYGSAQAPQAYGSAQAPPNSYGSAQALPNSYGSAQAPPNYGSAQAPNYGSAQAPPNYGSAQAPSYGSAQAPSPYGTVGTPTRAAAAAAAASGGGGGYEGPRGGNNAVRR